MNNVDISYLMGMLNKMDKNQELLKIAYKVAISYGIVYVDSNSNLTCK